MLIANRGEIAIRIARAAADLGIETVAIYPGDDAASLHVKRADVARCIDGQGAAAYLDIQQVIRAAAETNSDAIHPGYGFLSENAGFARACFAAGIVFVGPTPEALTLFGDKAAARELARRNGVPLARGTTQATTLDEAKAFLTSLGAGRGLMIKAVAGGGGRGMRVAHTADQLADAYSRAASEAKAAFGSDELYVEELISPARHVEVQVIADCNGDAAHLFERECSLQRRFQKVVEIAPFPGMDDSVRAEMAETALKLARAGGVHTVCTFEFLVGEDSRFVFMEANPRIQVEHTVTEEVLGVDLVKTQIELAAGRTLASLGLTQAVIKKPEGIAVELRINMEKIGPDGGASPTGGVLTAFDPPGGKGIRIETSGYAGYLTSSRYDSLLAKLIVHSPSDRLETALDRAYRALCEFRIEGVETNIEFLQSLLRDSRIKENAFDTGFIEKNAAELLNVKDHPKRYVGGSVASGKATATTVDQPDDTIAVNSPLTGRLVSYDVAIGDLVGAESVVAIVEAMKMEQVVHAGVAGIVRALATETDQTVLANAPLLFIEPSDHENNAEDAIEKEDGGAIRTDLSEVLERHHNLMDERRPDAVARRRRTGQRTARENIAHLCDSDSFVEYGALAIAAQRRRRSTEELIAISPADGLVAGIGTVNAEQFGETGARCVVLSYDYTVFAGTQGFMGHKKMDRLLHLADQWSLPLIVFAEGGGGRPGETDYMGVAGLDMPSFRLLAKLSGKAPTIAIVSGRCFAGNAAVAGSCDLIIATKNANLGMGGPAMIEGGGLGRFSPEEVGPADVQTANGVIDILVADEAEAVEAAQRYLSYFQGSLPTWSSADQLPLRNAVPENRMRAYDVRKVIDRLADQGSVLELRPTYGVGIMTTLVRIEGQPVGLFANNPRHLGGAIDAEAAEKAARFIELCEAYGLPILSLCDTPGFMVGPEAEKTALVRRVARMFVGAANITVPFLTIVLRKGYGLGAQAMAGGSTIAPFFTVAWPTGEFGGMGIEGAVNLAYRKELAAIEDPVARQNAYAGYVQALYDEGKATNMASFLEIDGVIDPAASRHWIRRALRSVSMPVKGGEKRRPFVTPR
jgi:acetyl/propionyl-CoA carboxylase alpha subunit/acetyl-CoA carboxylase carboxyltransferase component